MVRRRTSAPIVPTAAREVASPMRFMRVATAPVVRLEVDDGRDVAGCFVKLTPRLRRSEREAFDTGAAERALLDRGAVAAVVAPVVIPDLVRREVVAPRSVDARAEVVAWFGADACGDQLVARDRCLGILDEVGF